MRVLAPTEFRDTIEIDSYLNGPLVLTPGAVKDFEYLSFRHFCRFWCFPRKGRSRRPGTLFVRLTFHLDSTVESSKVQG